MGLLKRKDDYRLEKVDGELLLYHPGSTKILYCNETASLIWQLCDGTRGEKEIAGTLGEAYPEAAERIAADVRETVQLVLDNEALEWV